MSIRTSLRLILIIGLATSFAAAAQSPKSPKDQATKPPAASTASGPRAPTAAVAVPTSPSSSVPIPIARTRALARTGVPASALQAGRAVTYSADRLADNYGYLSARSVNLFRRDGRWLLGTAATGAPTLRLEPPSPLELEAGPGQVAITFTTRPGQRYLVDFAIGASVELLVAAGGRQSSQAPIDGHVPVIIDGDGAQRSVLLHGQGFTFYYVQVIPIG